MRDAYLHEAVTFNEVEHFVLLEMAEAKLVKLQDELDTVGSEAEDVLLDISLWESIIEKLQQAKQL